MTRMSYSPAPALPAPVKALPLAVLGLALVAGTLTSQGIMRLARADRPPPAAPPPAPAQAAISPLFTPEVQHWAAHIVSWAADYELDPNLVATVMQIESCGNAQVVSPSGAQGLFQVMPFHFAPGENMRDPDTNARRGLGYLATGLDLAQGKPGLALAGYNGGHSQISRLWSSWPAETRRYYYWGSGIYAEAAAGLEASPTLDEWLQAGGAHLCAKAHLQLGLP